MKIAVMSPSREQGTTTLCILLGQALAQTQGLTVCLTHSGLQNISFEAYLGQEKIEDKTKSITQLLRLLESKSLTGDVVDEFCTKVSHNFDIFNTNITQKNSDAYAKLLSTIMPNFKHDIVITDIVTELWEDITQQVVKQADLAIIVLTQNNLNLQKYKNWRESELFDSLKGKPTMYIVNKYDGYICAFKNYIKKFSLKHKQCCKVSYSPFICKTANLGQLHKLLPFILEKDIRVCQLNNEIRECMQVLMAHMGEQFYWR